MMKEATGQLILVGVGMVFGFAFCMIFTMEGWIVKGEGYHAVILERYCPFIK